MKTSRTGKNLTSRQTARILGVSEASVKRWADGGLLPAIKTGGGHRRFRPEDVAVFKRSGFSKNDTVAGEIQKPEAAGLNDGARAVKNLLPVDEIYESLTEGSEEEVSALLINLYLHGQSVGQIADEVLCPALRRIGDDWHSGKLTVAQEHIASRAVLEALSRWRSVLNAPRRENLFALCCCAENDFHEF